MILMYDGYTITGTVDEIKEFIEKMRGTTVSGNLNNQGIETLNISDQTHSMVNPYTVSAEVVKCPKCGSRHFLMGGGISTLVYTPMEFKDGKAVLGKEINKTINHYTCLDCGEEFDSSASIFDDISGNVGNACNICNTN